MSTHDLSELVSARLCHDLISPIGAIGNGLELFGLAGGAGGPELALVHDSLATALAKLRFYRVAFGPADAQARQSLEEAAQITDAMFGGRFTVAWDAGRGDLDRRLLRLAFLAILCLEKSLPMGGVVRVGLDDAAIALRVDGRRTQPPRRALGACHRRRPGRGSPPGRGAVRAPAAGAPRLGPPGRRALRRELGRGRPRPQPGAGRSPALKRAMFAR